MTHHRSWDVFDTLLARRYITSEPIWERMERETAIPNFAQRRMAADTGNRNLTQIYQAMFGEDPLRAPSIPELVALEVRHEMTNAIPIQENLDKVKHGDLLISDMYMEGHDIIKVLRSVGMNKQVTIYQSNGDKRSGAFWSNHQGKLPIQSHTGDNYQSDVLNATQHDFNAIHYPIIQSTPVESQLFQLGLPNLALLLREIRLANHEPKHHQLFHIASQLNLPWLFISCEMLRRYNTDQSLVFLGRDCQLMERIYGAYFNSRCYYLPFSRQVALCQPLSAARYLRNQSPKDALFIDISSTGRTWEMLHQNGQDFPVTVLIYSDLYHYSATKPELPGSFHYINRNGEFGQTNEILEVFNCGDHGKVSRIDWMGDVPLLTFDLMELDAETVQVIHQPVENAVALRQYYQTIRSELAQVSDENIKAIFGSLAMVICGTGIAPEGYLAKDQAYTNAVAK